MSPSLRPYQIAAVQRVREEVAKGNRRVVLQVATGGGKTVCAAAIAASAVSKGSRCLLVAHRVELVDQAARKLDEWGVENGVIKANHWKCRPTAPCQVASIQTLLRRNKPRADVIFFDECHLAANNSFREIAEHYSGAVLIGLSATPERLDGKPLSDIFDTIVTVATVRELVNDGYLLAPIVYAPDKPDMRAARLVRGDYDARDAAAACDKKELVGNVVDWWQKLALGRKTLVFATSIEHSRHIADEFKARGHRAEHVDGNMPQAERSRIFGGLANDTVDIAVCCQLATEGFDEPRLSCVVMARPTASSVLFRQMLGRGMRIFPGKADTILLDHAGNTYRHGFSTDLINYSLDGNRPDRGEPAVTVCRQCFCVRPVGPGACPVCNERQPSTPAAVRQAPEHVDGELVRVANDDRPTCPECLSDNVEHLRDPARLGAFTYKVKCYSCGLDKYEIDTVAAGKADTRAKGIEWKRLNEIGQRKGFKPGWSAYQYKAQFGVWPRPSAFRRAG